MSEHNDSENEQELALQEQFHDASPSPYPHPASSLPAPLTNVTQSLLVKWTTLQIKIATTLKLPAFKPSEWTT
jgi:hypothetical protein